MKIKSAILDSFGVRCPKSIDQKGNDKNILFVRDYENGCSTDNPDATAFCGRCSMKGEEYLFRNVNASMEFNHVCFAYKSSRTMTGVSFRAIDMYGLLSDEFSVNIRTIGDNKWHYTCGKSYFILSSFEQ